MNDPSCHRFHAVTSGMQTLRSSRRATWERLVRRPATPCRALHRITAGVAALLFAACVREPVDWVDPTEMANQYPSPLSFPGKAPFDSVQSDTSQAAEFARTQDLLREAGAVSVLESVLNAMPEADSLASTSPRHETTPEAMQHVMPMATSASMQIPGSDLGGGEAPIDDARCARSLRIVDAPGRGRVALWWTRRDRGRVFLVAVGKWNP